MTIAAPSRRERGLAMKRCALVLLLFCAMLAAPRAEAATVSTFVDDLTDRAYRDLDKLVAFGFCGPTIKDQRPYARSEFARLVAQAIEKRNAMEAAPQEAQGFERLYAERKRLKYIDEIIKRMTEEFREELVERGAMEGEAPAISGHPVEKLRMDLIYSSSAPLRIIPDNGYGTIDALADPFLAYRDGRHLVDGAQSSFEFDNRFRFGRHFALEVTPRVESNSWREGDANVEALLQRGYGVLQAGNAALAFGRRSVAWGPGKRGALLVTNNARSLDMVEFLTPSPGRLPWVFSHLGQWRISLLGANLGPDASFRYGWMGAWRLSYLPARYVEVGIGHTVLMGGEGAPSLTALEVVGEYFGFRPGGSSPGDKNGANQMMEGSVLLRIPQLWGVEIYGVLANEDKRDTLKRFLRDGSSYLAGLYLPRLNPSGTADFRFEFRRMCAIMYRHGLFWKGSTLNSLIIGDNLGPDAMGAGGVFRYELSPRFEVNAAFDWEVRRSDIHGDSGDPDGSLGDIVVVRPGPHEERYRLILAPRYMSAKGTRIDIAAGYERVLNAGYVQGLSRNNWLAAVGLTLDFDRFFRFSVR